MTTSASSTPALGYGDTSKYRDRHSALLSCSRYGYALRDASEAMRDDAAVVAAAVERRGYALGYASPRLRDHKPTV